MKENGRSREDWKVVSHRLRVSLPFLLLFVAVSFGIVGYIVGRTASVERYTGRTIGTITIGPHEPDEPILSEQYRINVHGKVMYTDGTPYRYGTVEIRSTPVVTTTDELGRFQFLDVSPGVHTISVIENGQVIAQCTVNILKVALIETARVIRLLDNTFLVEVPIELPEIELVLSIRSSGGADSGFLDVSLVPVVPPVGPVDPTDPTEPTDPPGPSEPGETDPGEPGGPEPPGPEEPGAEEPDPDDTEGSGAGALPETGPGLEITDKVNPSRIWTTLTAVDLFAEHPDNYGVSTISGRNVVAPGAHGVFAFRVKNPESQQLEYMIRLTEADENNPQLPMKYRLKRGMDGTDYVGGTAWRTADEVVLDWTALSGKDTGYHALEWMWDSTDDSIDTLIGSQSGTPLYVLSIVVSARYATGGGSR